MFKPSLAIVLRPLRAIAQPALLAFGLLLLAPAAHAIVLIGNYPSVNDVSGSTVAALAGDFSKAAGFTLPAGTDYTLDAVTLRLQRNDLAATLQVDLFADVGGNPGGAALLGFTVPAFGLGISDVVVTPSAPVTLLASTTIGSR